MANEYSYKVPEYYNDYQELIQQCINLIIQLLDECNQNHEVKTLLTQQTGIEKYTKLLKDAKYPRLTMAFESSVTSKCKNFVGHRFCQHVLRDSWFEDVPLREASTPFWILYIILQLILAPIFVFSYVIVSVGRQISKLDLQCVRNRPTNSWLDRCNNVQLHLDVPINRHLMHMSHYIIFACLVLWTILDYTYLNTCPEDYAHHTNPCANDTNVTWNGNACYSSVKPPLFYELRPTYSYLYLMQVRSILVMIFTVSIIWQNVHKFMNNPSSYMFWKAQRARFWRIYDMFMALIFCLGFILTFCRIGLNSHWMGQDDPEKSCKEERDQMDHLIKADGFIKGCAALLIILR